MYCNVKFGSYFENSVAAWVSGGIVPTPILKILMIVMYISLVCFSLFSVGSILTSKLE